MNYNSNYFTRILQGFSQFGHALSGGSPDISISGRTGYEFMNHWNWFWSLMKSYIDFTFKPIDGENHCIKAYKLDKNENYKTGRKTVMMPIVCFVFAFTVCSLIWCPIRVIALFSKFEQTDSNGSNTNSSAINTADKTRS